MKNKKIYELQTSLKKAQMQVYTKLFSELDLLFVYSVKTQIFKNNQI